MQKNKIGSGKKRMQREKRIRQREIDEDVSKIEGAGWNGEIRTRLDVHVVR
jgi:hypothetical protein